MSNRFSYLLDKIRDAEFSLEPFEHIAISNFFNDDDLAELLELDQIKLRQCEDVGQLIHELHDQKFEPIVFPGSITSEEKYIEFAEKGNFNRRLIQGYGRKVIEGYGITYRLTEYRSNFLSDLMALFEGEDLNSLVRGRFNIELPTSYEGGVQKNLRGYEISPHPDTSRKALTWMVNIYTDEDDVSEKEMHTHLCKFKDKYSYVYKVWENSDVDPVWVPWSWADTIKKTNLNNSIIIFKPSHKTLHAVRVSEDHLVHQRNQIYGNLWYDKSQKAGGLPWEKLDLFRKESVLEKILRRLS